MIATLPADPRFYVVAFIALIFGVFWCVVIYPLSTLRSKRRNYRVVDTVLVDYAHADRLFLKNEGWQICTEKEDYNSIPGHVWLEKVELIKS